MSTIIYPSHYRVFEFRSGRWTIKNIVPFSTFSGASVDYNDTTSIFGISEQSVVIKLFRTGAGKAGYYLANLRDKQYYYCGLTLDGVKATLIELGIGRADPVES